ncbi:MAG: hypothetical protein GTO24_05155 [candidate division Zixibacteria bacterium]|nr:hypothetical protein [candidate division Zixibacteria bacterium]
MKRRLVAILLSTLVLSLALFPVPATWCLEKKVPNQIPREQISPFPIEAFDKSEAFCEIYNDFDNPYFYFPEFDSGTGLAVYMNPAQCGEFSYPFKLTDVHLYLFHPGPVGWLWPVNIQVNVREPAGGDSCLGPDPQSALFSEVFSIPVDSSFSNLGRQMNLSLSTHYCLYQPFFLETRYLDHLTEGDSLPGLVMDGIDPPSDTCDNWFLWQDQYYEWYDAWMPPVPGDAIIRATGYAQAEDCDSSTTCPEDSNDHGACDTIHVDVYPADTSFSGAGHVVRVPIRVTNDIPTVEDSLTGFIIPLCYTHTNPGKSCSLTAYWNYYWYFGPEAERSIFRHLPGEPNVMMSFAEDSSGREWDLVILDLATAQSGEPGHFFLAMFTLFGEDQRWPGGWRKLLATITFNVEDTMTVSIDSCIWPPQNHLEFGSWYGEAYVPRHYLPCSFSISPARGDLNVDGLVDSGDVVFLINFVLRGGPPPVPESAGDLNGDDLVEIEDVLYLIYYLFMGGPPPAQP